MAKINLSKIDLTRESFTLMLTIDNYNSLSSSKIITAPFPYLSSPLCLKTIYLEIVFRYQDRINIQSESVSASITGTVYRVKYFKPIPKGIKQDTSTV